MLAVGQWLAWAVVSLPGWGGVVLLGGAVGDHGLAGVVAAGALCGAVSVLAGCGDVAAVLLLLGGCAAVVHAYVLVVPRPRYWR